MFPTLPLSLLYPSPPFPSFLTAKHPVLQSSGEEREEEGRLSQLKPLQEPNLTDFLVFPSLFMLISSLTEL